jgi:hypothetical protein
MDLKIIAITIVRLHSQRDTVYLRTVLSDPEDTLTNLDVHFHCGQSFSEEFCKKEFPNIKYEIVGRK